MCGSQEPGFNSPWFDNYSTCGPCNSLTMCLICEDGYEESDLIIRCSTCLRWCHGECDSIVTEDDAEKCSEAGYNCQLCRPNDVLPPHLALPKKMQSALLGGAGSVGGIGGGTPPGSPDFCADYRTGSFVVDGVVLSERGMSLLKAQTVEKEKARRRKRGLNALDSDRSIFDTIESVVSGGGSADNSMENDPDAGAGDDDDDLMPPPTPGPSSGAPGDGKAPDTPEGYTKENGQLVLKKRRYRDLKKVGIGGFQAKGRAPNKNKSKEDPAAADGDGDKPKKRQVWRPKKNKILAQYPEYIQDAFFGKEFMEATSRKVLSEPSRVVPSGGAGSSSGAGPGDNSDSDGESPKLVLGREAMEALTQLRKTKEAERRKRDEAAAKAKADEEARLASANANNLLGEPLDPKPGTSKEVKEEEDDKMEVDDDLLGELPSDIFGDELFKSLMNDPDGADGLGDIDDNALDEAEKENGSELSQDNDGDKIEGHNSLADALADELGPDFKIDSKEMEDIFKGMMDSSEIKTEGGGADDDKPKVKEETPSEGMLQQQQQVPPMQAQQQHQQPQSHLKQQPSPQISQPNANPALSQTSSAPISSSVSSTPQPQCLPPSDLNQQQQQHTPQQPPHIPREAIPSTVPPQSHPPASQPGMYQREQLPPRMMVPQDQQMAMQQRHMPQQQQQGVVQPQIMHPQHPMNAPNIRQPVVVPQGAVQQQQPPFSPSQTPLPVRPDLFHANQGQQNFAGAPNWVSGNGPSMPPPQPPQPPPKASEEMNVVAGAAAVTANAGPANAGPANAGPANVGPAAGGANNGSPAQRDTSNMSTQRNQFIKWENDEPLGENATIAMILYANKNHPNLKSDYPKWSDRIKQIAKV
jgi:histone-lysine N-methyltransferase MLL3